MENMYPMKTMKIDDRSLSCIVRYSVRRRTVQIRVSKPDCLEIAAPAGMSWDKIRQLIETKHSWIRLQVRRLETSAANPANSSLTHGATVLYQGAPHTLLLLADGKGKPHVTYAHCAISVHLTELIGQDNDPVVYRSLRRSGTWIRRRKLSWNGHCTGLPRSAFIPAGFPSGIKRPVGAAAPPAAPSATIGASSWLRRQCWTTSSSTSFAICCTRIIPQPTGRRSPAGIPIAGISAGGCA